MAESNVMGTYEFPSNIFDKILDNFSQAVQDNKYCKLDYVFWRKLKTNSVKRIDIKSDLNGKIFFDIFPDAYIMNSFFADAGDGSFGEYLVDNVCNIFTNDYAIECSEKFLEYKMRRAKKTVEKNNDISKTRDKLYCAKVYDKTAGWNTEFSSAWTIPDEDIPKILKELNTTPITVATPDEDCITGKVASVDSNTIFASTLAPITATLGSQIDAIKDKCSMIDTDYINDRINKVLNEQNTFNNVDDKKGNNKMKAFNFDFGPCTNDNIRMSMYGLAVKNAAGTWVSYNPESKEIIDVDIFNFDGGKFLYKMPVAIKDIAPGMVIVHNRKAMFVTETGDSGITVVDPQAGEEKKILPTKNCFNFNFYTRVVSLFDFLMKSPENTPSVENPFGNMWMFMLMDEKQDMSDMLIPMMFMNQSGNTFNGINPMMFMLMDGKQDMKDMIVPMMLMGTMNK